MSQSVGSVLPTEDPDHQSVEGDAVSEQSFDETVPTTKNGHSTFKVIHHHSKRHLAAATDHVSEHKRKYGAGCIAGIIAVVLGIVFGIILIVGKTAPAENPAAALVAGRTASTVAAVSVMPAKGESSSRRRLTADGIFSEDSRQEPYFLRKLETVKSPSDFDATSDYHTTPEPTQTVYDESAEVINLANTIGCKISQTNFFEVGLNKSCNNGEKPYVALVNDGLCESGKNSFSNFFVDKVVGPTGGGDGEYSTTLLLHWNGEFYVTADYKTTITGGVKVKQHMNFWLGNSVGYLQSTFDPSTKDSAIIFYMVDYATGDTLEKLDAKDSESYAYAKYNDEKFAGDVVTSTEDNGAVSVYELKISENAVNKKKTTTSGSSPSSTTTTCIDFTRAKQKIIDKGYKIFSAVDGSALKHREGFPIELTATGYDRKVEGYIDYWGFYAAGYDDPDKNKQDSPETIKALFKDGVKVQRVIKVGPEKNTEYTFRLAPARMMKVSKNIKTLADVKKMPLTIDNYGSALSGVKLIWDGAEFKKIGQTKYKCVKCSSSGCSYPTTAQAPSGWADCTCLDESNGTFKTDGTAKNYGIYAASYQSKASSNPTSFPLTNSDFPRGMQIKVGDDLYGFLKLTYRPVMRLYGLIPGTFTKGQTVTQQTSGAKGTVFKSTSTVIYGLTCGESNNKCMEMAQLDPASCGGSQADQSVSWIPKGLKLTQGTNTAIVDQHSGFWGGGIVVTGLDSTKWDTSTAVTIDLPSSKTGDLVHYSKFKSRTAPNAPAWATNSISRDWTAIRITDGAGCDKSGILTFSNSASTMSGSTNGEIKVYISHSSTPQRFYVWVSNQGTDCSNPAITEAHMNAALTAASITCTKKPAVTLKCERRIEAVSDRVDVLLADKKFPFAHSRKAWENDKPVKINDVDVGTPFWASKEGGDLVQPTDETQIEYRVDEVVVPGDDVPELACYDRCPETKSSGEISQYSSFEPKVVSSIEVDGAGRGECATKPTSATFNSITGLTFDDLKLEWATKETGSGSIVYELDAVSFKDPKKRGYNCGSTSSITFTGCSQNPRPTIQCENGLDQITGDQALLYSFDVNKGVITDKKSSYQHSKGATSSAHYGVFFEKTQANLEAQGCDHDSDVLCPWKANELSTYYEYMVGPQSSRASLVKEGGKSLKFDKPKLFSYKHAGDKSNSGESYDGATFLLRYYGQGDESIHGLPKFCMNSDGVPSDCDPSASTSIADIKIPAKATIEGQEGAINGKKFYTKPASKQEFYPKATDATICNALQFGGQPALTLPKLSTQFTFPNNGEMLKPPTKDQLKADFMNAGKPSVVGGVPLFELDGSDGKCVA
jgi:hypothetical protein